MGSLPFVAHFGFFYCLVWFFSQDACFGLLSLFAAFCCFCCLFLLFLVFHGSYCQQHSIGPELVQMNENGNKKCCLLLFVAHFGFWGVFLFAFHCFCCSLLLFLVFEIESVLSQKPKQANAFGCSFWLFVAHFIIIFCRCFHLNIASLMLVFCW